MEDAPEFRAVCQSWEELVRTGKLDSSNSIGADRPLALVLPPLFLRSTNRQSFVPVLDQQITRSIAARLHWKQ